MVKKLDKYIIRKFIGAFFFTVALFIVVSVVVDLSEKMDDFLENDVSFYEATFGYYMNFIPFIVFFLSPLFVFIAVIFFTSQLAYRSEIVAILSSGVSFNRILFVPYFIGALILFGIQFGANHLLVPKANEGRIQFENTFFKKKVIGKQRQMHLQISPDQFLYLGSYNNQDSIGTNFTLERFENFELKEKISARRIKWKTDKELWELGNYKKRTIDGEIEELITGAKKDTSFSFHPDDLIQRTYLKEAMTTPQLMEYIDEQREIGAGNVEELSVELHRRTSVPFATFILTVIGFSLASRKVRGGMGLHLILGIALSAAYILFMQFSTTFAINGNLSPFIAVWIPNILFGLLSIYLLRVAPK